MEPKDGNSGFHIYALETLNNRFDGTKWTVNGILSIELDSWGYEQLGFEIHVEA